jgi:hypothetical protein
MAYLPGFINLIGHLETLSWRLSPESNRGQRLCRPLHNHSATQPLDSILPDNVARIVPGMLYRQASHDNTIDKNAVIAK